MLTRETIDRLVNCQLPAETIRQHLLDLSSERIDMSVLSAFIDSIKENSAFRLEHALDALDCSGTGGSGLPHFNTSTTVAFVLAAGGVRVAKFGNRAARSLSGSFDLLEALGIPSTVPFERTAELLDQVGVVFLFAPHYYPSLVKLAPIRRSLPGPSIFNSIGPLLHPLNPRHRLMGVSDPLVYKLVAEYLANDSSTQSAIVVRSRSGLDEFDPCSTTDFAHVARQLLGSARLPACTDHHSTSENHYDRPGELPGSARVRACTDHHSASENDDSAYSLSTALTHHVVEPIADLTMPLDAMTSEHNHDVFHQILNNAAHPYFMHLVCLNAGAGFKAYGLSSTIEEGVSLAQELIVSGAAKSKFEQCRRAYASFIG